MRVSGRKRKEKETSEHKAERDQRNNKTLEEMNYRADQTWERADEEPSDLVRFTGEGGGCISSMGERSTRSLLISSEVRFLACFLGGI